MDMVSQLSSDTARTASTFESAIVRFADFCWSVNTGPGCATLSEKAATIIILQYTMVSQSVAQFHSFLATQEENRKEQGMSRRPPDL